jgi:subtilisin
MVGGFIAALDNSIGRVGVAPGARLWAVGSLDSHGHGLTSGIICGLDWVTRTRTDVAPGNDIAIANMSLGGLAGPSEGTCEGGEGNDAMHIAICRTVGAGVTVVAAADESKDLRRIAPATYDAVLAVTAMSDRDGLPGALAGQLNCLPSETDDTAATFSNFATLTEDRAHTVAAPGELHRIHISGRAILGGVGKEFRDAPGLRAQLLYVSPQPLHRPDSAPDHSEDRA